MNRMSPAGFGLQATRTDRDNEYAVFSRVTGLLGRANSDDGTQIRIESLAKNIELWTTLLSDLSEKGNRLPDSLKAGLISLAIFSLRYSHQALAENIELTPLIDVNSQIMIGLRGGRQP